MADKSIQIGDPQSLYSAVNTLALNKDPEAIEYYKKCANSIRKAKLRLAEIYYYGELGKVDKAEGLKWANSALEDDLDEAHAWIASTYLEARDYKAAVPHLEKAAAKGHPNANYDLGVFYRDGLGVEKDSEKAFQYLKAAADLGHRTGQYEIAILYLKKETLNDLIKADEYMSASAQQGLPEAGIMSMKIKQFLIQHLKKISNSRDGDD